MRSQRTRWSWKSLIAAVACIGLIIGMQLAAPPSARATTSGTVTVTGAPIVGFLLTASPSGFAETPYRYAWYTYADASGGSGAWVADGQTYTPGSGDVDRYILVVAFTSTGNVLSERVGPIVPFQVTIEGEAKVGKTLTTTQSGFSADVSISWRTPAEGLPDWEEIGTGASYEIKAADLGKYIFAFVEDNVNVGRNKNSAQVGPVADPDITAGTPQVFGTAQAGETLYSSDGLDWSPEPDSFTHQWLSDGAEISGATDTYLALTAANVGHQISVRVTGSKSGYTAASATSAKTAKVLAAPVASLGTPVVRSVTIQRGRCAVLPVKVGYQVPAKLADSLSSVKVTARATNYKGARIGTVVMTSTATSLTGTATGQFRWCASAGLGKVTFSNLTGSWTGTHTVVPVSKVTPVPTSGVFTSRSTVKIRVRAAVRFVDPQPSARGASKSLTVKFQAYRPSSQRWSGVGRGAHVSVQKKVGSRWVTVDTAATGKSAGKVSLTWRATAKATYRVVWAGSGTKKSATSSTFTL